MPSRFEVIPRNANRSARWPRRLVAIERGGSAVGGNYDIEVEVSIDVGKRRAPADLRLPEPPPTAVATSVNCPRPVVEECGGSA